MKKIDLSQTVSVLANAGIIAGILFLVFELRQNNDLLESEARSNLDANRVSMQQNIVEDSGGIAELMYRARMGEQLTGLENWRLGVRRSMVLFSFESMYQEVRTGPLVESDIPLRQWVGSFSSDPGMRVVWDTVKNDMDPDFVQFVDQRVLPMADAINRE